WRHRVEAHRIPFDGPFRTPAGHQGVTGIAAPGDSGANPVRYPAAAPNVVGVGGTTLTIQPDGSYGQETGWSNNETNPPPGGGQRGSGGGFSNLEHRAVPDVGFLADPATGVAVFTNGGSRGSGAGRIKRVRSRGGSRGSGRIKRVRRADQEGQGGSR